MKKFTRGIAGVIAFAVIALIGVSCAPPTPVVPVTWYGSISWDYETTATGNQTLEEFGYGSDVDYWYFKVKVSLANSESLPGNGGINAYISIDDLDSASTAQSTNTYSQWSLGAVQLTNFTPDYGIVVQAKNPNESANGMAAINNDQIELFSRNSGSANTADNTLGKIYKDITAQQLDTTQTGAAYDSGVYYLRVPKSTLSAANIKAVAWVWAAGGAWGDTGTIKGPIATLPLQTQSVTNQTNGTVINPFDTYGDAVSTPVSVLALDKTSYLGVSGDAAVFSLIDSGLDTNSNAVVSVTVGSITNFSLTLAYNAAGNNWTNTITLGTNGSGADVEANVDYTLSVSYVAQAAGVGTVSDSASVISVAPAATVDGLKDAWWFSAPSAADNVDSGQSWGTTIEKVMATNNGTTLFIAVDTDTPDGQFNQFGIFIDTGAAGGFTNCLIAPATNMMDEPVGIIMTNTSVGFEVGLRIYNTSGGYVARLGDGTVLTNDIGGNTAVGVSTLNSTAGGFVETSFDLATLGLSSSDVIKIVVVGFHYWGGGYNVNDYFPETASPQSAQNNNTPALLEDGWSYTID